jgi:hypothetical protein
MLSSGAGRTVDIGARAGAGGEVTGEAPSMAA